jgi:hypothetical protein
MEKTPFTNLIRYMPDFMIIKKHSPQNIILVEVKNSLYMERDAFNRYIYFNSLATVWVVVKDEKSKSVYMQSLEDLILKPAFESGSASVVDGWEVSKNGNGSGKPFRLIDVNSMTPIPDFRL